MKQKTRKSVIKKIKVSGGKKKKLMHRGSGQNHYNTRDTGSKVRGKRLDQGFFKTDEANIKKALPYA